MMRLTTAQLDRACGAVLASAAGDALGAGYEFGCAAVGLDGPQMIGGGLGGFAKGEWTDDTSMSIVVLEAAAAASLGHDLRLPSSLDQIAREWYAWSMGTPDIGAMTSKVMGAAIGRAVSDGRSLPTAADFEAAAHCVAEHTTNTRPRPRLEYSIRRSEQAAHLA